MTTYNDFAAFAQAVEAHRQANPDWIRLNGRPTTGSRDPWAYFLYADRKWKVDVDSSFLPIFYRRQTSTGNR